MNVQRVSQRNRYYVSDDQEEQQIRRVCGHSSGGLDVCEPILESVLEPCSGSDNEMHDSSAADVSKWGEREGHPLEFPVIDEVDSDMDPDDWGEDLQWHESAGCQLESQQASCWGREFHETITSVEKKWRQPETHNHQAPRQCSEMEMAEMPWGQTNTEVQQVEQHWKFEPMTPPTTPQPTPEHPYWQMDASKRWNSQNDHTSIHFARDTHVREHASGHNEHRHHPPWAPNVDPSTAAYRSNPGYLTPRERSWEEGQSDVYMPSSVIVSPPPGDNSSQPSLAPVQENLPSSYYHIRAGDNANDDIDLPPPAIVTANDSNGIPRRFRLVYVVVSLPLENDLSDGSTKREGPDSP